MFSRLIRTAALAALAASGLPGMHSALAQQERQATASPETPACAQEHSRQFDFWVGEWEVQDAEGRVAGVNRISSEEGGCAIVERWSAVDGRTGQSLNYFDPAATRWKQTWVGLGLLLHMQGSFSDGHMRLEGPLQYLGQGRVTTLRGTWTPLSDGRVRQHFEESEDGGKSWATWFDGYYTRR